jgi:hypothetical protein
VTREFLYIPECPVELMGRDLLSQLRAQISFQEDGQVFLSFGSGSLRVLAVSYGLKTILWGWLSTFLQW